MIRNPLENKMQRKPRPTGMTGTSGVPSNPTTTPMEVLGVSEVAKLLGVPDSSIYEWCRFRATNKGSVIPHRRLGKYLKFLRHEVEAWILQMPHDVKSRKRSYEERTEGVPSP